MIGKDEREKGNIADGSGGNENLDEQSSRPLVLSREAKRLAACSYHHRWYFRSGPGGSTDNRPYRSTEGEGGQHCKVVQEEETAGTASDA